MGGRLLELHRSGTVERDRPLAPLSTYRVGGAASFFAEPADRDTLRLVTEAAAEDGVVVFVVGRGSNLVFSDAGFDGLVLRLGEGFTSLEITEERVFAGAAVPLPLLARTSVSEGRAGLEFYVGIPGSVGGAVRQNAGGHGRQTSEVLQEVEILDAATGVIGHRSVTQLDLRYRHSNLLPHEVVLAASFTTEPGDPGIGEEELRRITRWRREHQPGGTFNAGSVFKNPEGDSAGRLIDEVGLKGHTVGSVTVSEKHANFFVADPGATAAEIHALMLEVRRRVGEQTGVVLEPEIGFIGDFGS